MIESMDMEDAIIDLIDWQVDPSTAEKALFKMGYGACEKLYAPASAAHLVLVHGNQDYAFTSYDLGWLEKAETVLSYHIDEETNIFFVEMSSCIDEYYLDAAALIKIMNVAFPVKNFYVLRISENIAFGVARDFDNHSPNNFAVSGLINRNNINLYEDFLFDISTADFLELPDIVISNSPQEQEVSWGQVEYKNATDYLSFLSEFEFYYGVDTSRERAKFWDEFYSEVWDESRSNMAPTCTYKIACEELNNVVGELAVSSYEDLDTAQLAEEKTRDIQIADSSNDNLGLLNSESLGFSEEAFEDAEQMLKEMLQKGN